MNTIRKFLATSLASGLLLRSNLSGNGLTSFLLSNEVLKSMRPTPEKRMFVCAAIENAITQTKKSIADPELAWMFEN